MEGLNKMENKKFNSMELKVFNLIREGKSRSEIATCGITTTSNLNAILVNIYDKTEDIVGYCSRRDKFKELQCFLRNNPNVLTPFPEPGKVGDVVPEPVRVGDEFIKQMYPEPKISVTTSTKPAPIRVGYPVEPEVKHRDIHAIIKKLNEQYKQALEVNKAKLSVLDDIEKELSEGA